MSNKYLSKVASNPVKASLTSKIGLGVSIAGLGMAGANFANNHQAKLMENQRIHLERERVKLEEEQRKLDERSLRALGNIHKALTASK